MENATTRLDQIGLLTRGIRLPLQPLSDAHLTLLTEFLKEALVDLEKHFKQVLRSAPEKEVNALMETRLRVTLREEEFWSEMISGVARGVESFNFDGSHLENRPDLSISLTDRQRAFFPVTIECKIIDSASGKGITLYCDHGIMRYISGEYAWAAREALMLAYVRDKSTPDSCLIPLLMSKRTCEPDPYYTENDPFSIQNQSAVACSHHTRSFNYPAELGQHDPPGCIKLWHIWWTAC